jgi:hypothetical protein
MIIIQKPTEKIFNFLNKNSYEYKILDKKYSLHQEPAEKIIKFSETYFALSRDIMFLETRKEDIVKPRQILMASLCCCTKLSLSEIGYACGGKDHATVLHAKSTVQKLIDTNDPKWGQKAVEFLKAARKMKLPDIKSFTDEEKAICDIIEYVEEGENVTVESILDFLEKKLIAISE